MQRKSENPFQAHPDCPAAHCGQSHDGSGRHMATVGFPNIGLQGFAPKLAKGEIASLSGAGDDPRYFQISMPVQPGNSGGALVEAGTTDACRRANEALRWLLISDFVKISCVFNFSRAQK